MIIPCFIALTLLADNTTIMMNGRKVQTILRQKHILVDRTVVRINGTNYEVKEKVDEVKDAIKRECQ